MKRRQVRSALLAVVLVIAAGFLSVRVYTAWRHLDDPVAFDVGERALEELPQATDPMLPGTPSPAELVAVVERPIFSPTRRPPQPAPAPAAAPTPPAPPPVPPAPIEFSLVGIALSEGDRVALVRRQGDGKVFRVVEGGDVLGWTATSIDREWAVFRQGEREEKLEMRFFTAPSISGLGSDSPASSSTAGDAAQPNLPPAPDGSGGAIAPPP